MIGHFLQLFSLKDEFLKFDFEFGPEGIVDLVKFGAKLFDLGLDFF